MFHNPLSLYPSPTTKSVKELCIKEEKYYVLPLSYNLTKTQVLMKCQVENPENKLVFFPFI